MPGLLDLSDALDLLVRIETFVGRFVFGDWKNALTNAGPAGAALEAGKALLGSNAWNIHVSREHGWSGGELVRFLHRYGIRTWGHRITDKHLILTVERRQARWAEYLLLRRGIPIDSAIFDARNLGYAQQHAPGDQPPAWADRKADRKSAAEKLLDWLP